MRAHRKNTHRTKAQQRRFDEMKECGCLVAGPLLKVGWVYAEIHHLLSGGRRRGDDFTIALNPWSHRGVPIAGLTAAECERVFGPSLARNSRAFHERFGTDDELLDLQNEWLRAKAEFQRA